MKHRRIKSEKDWQSSVWKHFIFISETKMCKCNHCPKMMARGTSSMRYHLKTFHNIEDNTPLGPRPAEIKYAPAQRIKCDKCEKIVNDLEKHNAARHEKSFCDHCGKEYRNRFRLQRHIYELHNKNPPPHLAEKRLKQKSENTTSEVFKCEECEKVFKKKNSLILHKRGFHEGKKDFMCTHCGFCTLYKQALKFHITEVHEGRKDHKCKHCGKDFSSDRAIKRHIMTVHEGLKPYQCPHCGIAYGQSNDLKRHIQKVHSKHV